MGEQQEQAQLNSEQMESGMAKLITLEKYLKNMQQENPPSVNTLSDELDSSSARKLATDLHQLESQQNDVLKMIKQHKKISQANNRALRSTGQDLGPEKVQANAGMNGFKVADDLLRINVEEEQAPAQQQPQLQPFQMPQYPYMMQGYPQYPGMMPGMLPGMGFMPGFNPGMPNMAPYGQPVLGPGGQIFYPDMQMQMQLQGQQFQGPQPMPQQLLSQQSQQIYSQQSQQILSQQSQQILSQQSAVSQLKARKSDAQTPASAAESQGTVISQIESAVQDVAKQQAQIMSLLSGSSAPSSSSQYGSQISPMASQLEGSSPLKSVIAIPEPVAEESTEDDSDEEPTTPWGNSPFINIDYAFARKQEKDDVRETLNPKKTKAITAQPTIAIVQLLATLLFVGAFGFYVFARIAWSLNVGKYTWLGIIVALTELTWGLLLILVNLVKVKSVRKLPPLSRPKKDEIEDNSTKIETIQLRVLIFCGNVGLDTLQKSLQSVLNAQLPNGVSLVVYLVDDHRDLERMSVAAQTNTPQVQYIPIDDPDHPISPLYYKSRALIQALLEIYPSNQDIDPREFVLFVDGDQQMNKNSLQHISLFLQNGIQVVQTPVVFDDIGPSADIFDQGEAYFWQQTAVNYHGIGQIPSTSENLVVKAQILQKMGWIPKNSTCQDWVTGQRLTATKAPYHYYKARALYVETGPDHLGEIFETQLIKYQGHYRNVYGQNSPLFARGLSILQRIALSLYAYLATQTAFITPILFAVQVAAVLTGIIPIQFSRKFGIAFVVYYGVMIFIQHFMFPMDCIAAWHVTISQRIFWFTSLRACFYTLLYSIGFSTKKQSLIKENSKSKKGSLKQQDAVEGIHLDQDKRSYGDATADHAPYLEMAVHVLVLVVTLGSAVCAILQIIREKQSNDVKVIIENHYHLIILALWGLYNSTSSVMILFYPIFNMVGAVPVLSVLAGAGCFVAPLLAGAIMIVFGPASPQEWQQGVGFIKSANNMRK